MFGKYAAFIIPSYAATALVIGALALWIILVHRRYRRELAELEARGIRRGTKAGAVE